MNENETPKKESIKLCHDKKLAHDGIEYYNDFFQSEMQVKSCGDGKIVKVLVRELKENEISPYWAWWDNKDNCFCMIFHSRKSIEVCFEYGYKIEEDRGNGKLTNVAVELI